jgi:hypothetical protein
MQRTLLRCFVFDEVGLLPDRYQTYYPATFGSAHMASAVNMGPATGLHNGSRLSVKKYHQLCSTMEGE